MVNKKAINTRSDGTCRTIISWYANGGKIDFAALNRPDKFLMTAVLEEYDEYDNMKLIDRYIVDHQGYGKADPRPGSHMVKPSRKDVCTTLTTFCGLNKKVIEIYED